MALSDIKKARIAKVVGGFVEARRPPPRLRTEIDLAFRVSGQSVEIYEVRPRWQGGAGETMEHPVAKATYVSTRAQWKVFWQRADLKWHIYPPAPQVTTIHEFVKLVAEDKHACFFG